MILGENGEKMSKSRGNVVNPDDIVREYGADTLRTYEMFIGAFDLSASWSEDGVKGCRRFLERVWKLQDLMTDEEGYSADMETKMHQTIKKVSSDFENLKYNTAIAAMMALINDFYKKNAITRGEFKTLITLLNPVAPHITEELWQIAGFEGKVYQTAWLNLTRLRPLRVLWKSQSRSMVRPREHFPSEKTMQKRMSLQKQKKRLQINSREIL